MTSHATEHQSDTIRALVRALDLHGPGEGGHAERVAVYAVATGEKMRLTFDELLTLRRAAALHDLGKLGLDRALLSQPGPLDEAQSNEVRAHCLMALQVVGSFEWLRAAVPMIRHHHERWDGQGYPDGLTGESIPLGARIIAVAESFDVLTFGAPWRPAVSEAEAVRELQAGAGSQFDPTVVAAFLEVQPLIQPVAV
ncbi:MAG: HD domain-containing protein [Fimbriimonadaceae bacterium]|nr:HD domain-containing protein [Fimbriimonadaceae bacterium]QYK57210.1 MAG: HD domain-containing protein [Fimbriimonadaceae bacterium]